MHVFLCVCMHTYGAWACAPTRYICLCLWICPFCMFTCIYIYIYIYIYTRPPVSKNTAFALKCLITNKSHKDHTVYIKPFKPNRTYIYTQSVTPHHNYVTPYHSYIGHTWPQSYTYNASLTTTIRTHAAHYGYFEQVQEGLNAFAPSCGWKMISSIIY